MATLRTRTSGEKIEELGRMTLEIMIVICLTDVVNFKSKCMRLIINMFRVIKGHMSCKFDFNEVLKRCYATSSSHRCL